MSKEIEKFNKDCAEEIRIQGSNNDLKQKSIEWLNDANNHKYSYHFKWMNSIKNNENYDITNSQRKVLALDIDIREHNKKEILNNPFSKYIEMLEGSSIDDSIINKVHNIAKNFKKILIFLDSNHTHEHVLEELNAYANLTSVGSYIVVFDTVIDYLPENHLPNESNPSMSEARTYTKGNSPMSAVREFLKDNKNFKIVSEIDSKLLISVAPEGYLKRIS